MQKLKIDQEFKSLIPPLSSEEFKQLEENIITDGCRESLVVWNDIIVDGHNRYKICTDNNVDFQVVQKGFKDRSEVIMWMLKNQLGRRNLSDFQRNEVALKYDAVIAERMKEKQSKAGGDKVSISVRTAVDQMNHSGQEKTSKRKELAKIAGTSEGSIQRSKLILEKGTEEQIERARKGGKGNNVTAISKEINREEKSKEDTKICSKCKKKLPISGFYMNNGKPKSQCKSCENSVYRPTDFMSSRMEKHKLSPEIARLTEEEIIGDLYDESKIKPHTVDDLIRDFTCNFDIFLETLRGIIEIDKKLLSDAENNKKMAAILSQAVAAVEQMKGDYIHE